LLLLLQYGALGDDTGIARKEWLHFVALNAKLVFLEKAHIAKDLHKIRERYTSLEQMAEALRSHPGFEAINRATLSRWLVNPAGRAALAARILLSKQHPAKIRVAEPELLWVLPSMVLRWPAQRGTPCGSLERNFGVEVVVQPVIAGVNAVELLTQGRVEVALAAREVIERAGPDCSRICRLSEAPITGIALNPVASIYDLEGLVLTYPQGSAVYDRIMEIRRSGIIKLPEPIPFQDESHCIELLRLGTATGALGWEPIISHVKRSIEDSLSLHSIAQNLFPPLKIDVAINMKIANASSVRAYLWGLLEAARFVEKQKAVDDFHIEIANKFRMSKSDVRDVMRSTRFVVDEVDPLTVLTLWGREAGELRLG